jgi:hypothetical protein
MPRGMKKTGLNTDSSIVDAQKRARQRRKQLEAASGITSNPIDDLNDELEQEGMSDYEKEVFN